MDENKIIEVLRTKGSIYDLVANHYWEMSKEELKDLLLEFIYVTDESNYDDVADELVDRWGLDSEDD